MRLHPRLARILSDRLLRGTASTCKRRDRSVSEVSGKLLPRNLAALRAGADPGSVPQAAGNPASTLLQSGVGNCFPGLEFDMRNLERRFFPFLEVDTNFARLFVASVDLAGA